MLGIRVVEVDRWDDPKRDGRRTWRLWLGTPDGTAHGPIAFTTGDFHRAASLSGRLRWYGRDPDLPPLTSQEGRRALRLMHEHVESKTTKENNR